MPQSSENTGSSLSIAQTLTCPSCGRESEAELWLIVDTSQRPDLVERIRAGQLHELPCPHCGEAVGIDAPLLLYRPAADPPLLFSPANQTSDEQNREQAAKLVATLRQLLADAWQDQWLAEGLRGLPRETLADRLSDHSQACLAESRRTRGGIPAPSLFGADLRRALEG